MPQIPLLSGIRASQQADFAVTYPINLEPVPLDTGISKGYLRTAAGAANWATGPGIDRGGVVWKGTLYRVMGTKLVSVSQAGAVSTLGDVGGTGPVSMTYGFDRLAVRSGTNLYYWDGATLVQVTDPDLGQCLDVLWMDGYYVSTDGTSIIVTQLSDPTSIDPLKYGSAESDPDMITGLIKLRSELYVLGQYTIEVFTDQGGSLFPFARSDGATIPIGCVGAQAKTLFAESFAFVGAGRGDAPGIWIAQGGGAQKISTRTIDDLLAAEPNQAGIALERRVSRDEERLIVHLSDRSFAFLRRATEKAGEEVWQELRSGQGMDKPYRPRNLVYAYGEWIVGDRETAALAKLDDATGEHFGEVVGWQFQTQLTYNASKGGIVHGLELIGLPGRGQTGAASAFFSYTVDGQQWSIERAISLGLPNERAKRVQWRPHKRFSNYLGLRFRGDSSALAGWAALEADIEGLAV